MAVVTRVPAWAFVAREPRIVPEGGHEVDTLWRAERLIVEIDGFEYHRTREAFERDRLRAGYRVMRVTWRQISE